MVLEYVMGCLFGSGLGVLLLQRRNRYGIDDDKLWWVNGVPLPPPADVNWHAQSHYGHASFTLNSVVVDSNTSCVSIKVDNIPVAYGFHARRYWKAVARAYCARQAIKQLTPPI